MLPPTPGSKFTFEGYVEIEALFRLFGFIKVNYELGIPSTSAQLTREISDAPVPFIPSIEHPPGEHEKVLKVDLDVFRSRQRKKSNAKTAKKPSKKKPTNAKKTVPKKSAKKISRKKKL